nr:phage/plasmid primase, P4 family [Sulfolobus islandicus]
MNEKLQYAQWFVNNGFAIFPIDKETKKPVISEWQKYSREKLTEEEKAEFLKMIGEQNYNYAIPGGQKGLVVLDFEDLQLLKQWISEPALDDLCKQTLCVQTPHGGLHIFVISYEIPEHKFNPAFTLNGKGIVDLQSYNSYVLGVGSCINHKYCESPKCPRRGQDHTTCYTLYNNELVPIVETVRGLKEFLKWLDEIAKQKKLGIELSPSAKEWVYGKTEAVEEEEFKKLKEDMAKYNKFKGKTVEAVREEVCKEMKKSNEELKEKSQKWKAIYNTAIPVICDSKSYTQLGIDRSRGDWRVFRALFTHGVADLDVVDKLLPADSKVYSPKWNRYMIHTIAKAWKYSKPALKFQKEAQGKNEKEAKKIARKIITEAVLERYKIKAFYQVTGHNQAIVGTFVWDKKKGIYVPFDKGLRKVIRKLAESLQIKSRDKTLARLSKRDVDDIVDEIKDLKLTPIPAEPLRVAFKNVTIEWAIKANILHRKTPKQYSFYYLPWTVNYEEFNKMKSLSIQEIEELAKRLCPKSLETFKSWVGVKWILLFQIIGYTLYPGIKFRKAFMLVGEGKNGKSSFINLVKKVLGDYAVSISPRELFDPRNRFIVGNLYHKLANAVAESKDYSIDDMDRVKRLTGDDWITADVKFKDPITFKSVAKLIIASNNMPHVRDTNDRAFWHRWVIVEFPHQFKDNDSWFDKTFTEEEINGIITTAIASISRAFAQGHVDFEQSEEEVMGIWLSHIDSVYNFIKTYVEKGTIRLDPKNGDLWVPKDQLYNLYQNYCIEQGFRGVGRKSFSRKLREYFGITVSQKGAERDRAFVGIAVDPIDLHNELTKNIATVNDFPEFTGFVVNHNGEVVEFTDMIREFGNDKEKANRFVAWCEKKNMCFRISWNQFRILAG